jgi:hypothetical protein
MAGYTGKFGHPAQQAQLQAVVFAPCGDHFLSVPFGWVAEMQGKGIVLCWFALSSFSSVSYGQMY